MLQPETMMEIHRRGKWRKRDREIDRESELVLTVAILSRAARSINIPRLHCLYRSTWTGSSKRFSFVCSFAEKKSFRRDYATDTWNGLRVERAAGRREKGDGEIGFALQSRRSVTMGHSNERKYASAYSLWIIQLHDYPRPPSIGVRCTRRLVKFDVPPIFAPKRDFPRRDAVPFRFAVVSR